MLASTYKKLIEFEEDYAACHVSYVTLTMDKKEYNKVLRSLLGYVTSFPKDTPKEVKLYVLYRTLTANIKYTRNDDDDEAFSYLGALKGRAVCMGISELFSILCKEIGIEVKTVIGYAYNVGLQKESEGEAHAWNMVRIPDIYGQEKWYHVDVTWDLDEVYHEVSDNKRFYLKDDNYMREHGHFWLSDRYPECTSKIPLIHNHKTNRLRKALSLSCEIFKKLLSSAS